MGSATNGVNWGQLRPHIVGRTPPFLLIGLMVVLAFLGFSCWSLSSQYNAMNMQYHDLQDQLRIAAQKRQTAEQYNDVLQNKLQEAEVEGKIAKTHLDKKDHELVQTSQQLRVKEEEIKGLKIDLTQCTEKSTVLRKDYTNLQDKVEMLKAENTMLKENITAIKAQILNTVGKHAQYYSPTAFNNHINVLTRENKFGLGLEKKVKEEVYSRSGQLHLKLSEEPETVKRFDKTEEGKDKPLDPDIAPPPPGL